MGILNQTIEISISPELYDSRCDITVSTEHHLGIFLLRMFSLNFPGATVDKNLPADAEDMV